MRFQSSRNPATVSGFPVAPATPNASNPAATTTTAPAALAATRTAASTTATPATPTTANPTAPTTAPAARRSIRTTATAPAARCSTRDDLSPEEQFELDQDPEAALDEDEDGDEDEYKGDDEDDYGGTPAHSCSPPEYGSPAPGYSTQPPPSNQLALARNCGAAINRRTPTPDFDMDDGASPPATPWAIDPTWFDQPAPTSWSLLVQNSEGMVPLHQRCYPNDELPGFLDGAFQGLFHGLFIAAAICNTIPPGWVSAVAALQISYLFTLLQGLQGGLVCPQHPHA
jgi:hypothetical protein